MKILKIILLLVTSGLAVFFTIGMYVLLQRAYGMPMYDVTMISLSFSLSTLCAIYHVMTLSYYTKKKSGKATGKLFWIAAIACSLFAVYVAGHEFTSLYLGADIQTEVLIVMSLVFVYGVLNIVEVVYLRKLIKQQTKTSFDAEIDSIGNS